MTRNILITGANGQIGTVLYDRLSKERNVGTIVASDISPVKNQNIFEHLNILDKDQLYKIVKQYEISEIYHLAAILSANGELKPLPSWDINMKGLFNVLEAARELNINKVFYPSSIAVFGYDVARSFAFQESPKNPSSVYGISKVAGENWARYYFDKYNVDVRSVRFPGIISYQSLPGGGTTDYAVEIFYEAIKTKSYTSFLSADSTLPMIYMDDAIDSIITLMACPSKNITERGSYNLRGISFSPEELSAAIKKKIPDFKISYAPDFRQKISDSWPASIDDDQFRQDTGFKHRYDLDKMVDIMIQALKNKLTPESTI